MKILILNASPRPKGLISQMLAIIASQCKEQGWEVENIIVHKLTIRPCIGCMKCRAVGDCNLPADDGHATLQKITECDVLIIGSPCYWGNIPGYLKMLFDRMVYGMMSESRQGIPQALHKGKQALIVTTCTTPWPFNQWFNQTTGVVKALNEILKWSGFQLKGTIQRGGTKQHPLLSESDQKKCRSLIKKINIK